MIARTFASLHDGGEIALIAYLTAGFPSPRRWLDHLHTLVESGADMVEIGIPFSDPVADGPTIQHASQTALEQGTRLSDVLDALASETIRIPVVVMSYLNPLLAFGRQRVVERISRAGVAGLIVPDLPMEEALPWLEETRANGLSLIPLVAPTSDDERIGRILDRSDGFVYYVSVTGTTGTRVALDDALPSALAHLRQLTERPVVVGFGISLPDHVRHLRGACDGVVVGSRIVEAIRGHEDLSELIRNLKQATRSRESC